MIKIFCDCCKKEITQVNIDKRPTSTLTAQNPAGETIGMLMLCRDCTDKVQKYIKTIEMK